MRLPQIRMESTWMKVGLAIRRPIQRIRQEKAELEIRQPRAEMNIHTERGKLEIDQSEAFVEANIKPPSLMAKETARAGNEAAMEGIARRAEQGRELMEIENGGNPIASQAVENGTPPEKQLSIGWIPSFGSVRFHYEPADVLIQITPRHPGITVAVHQPEHEYNPGSAETYIIQWNSLKIDFVHLFDEKV